MSIQLPPRGLITDALVAHMTAALAATNVLVGDGDRPSAAGWEGNQPGQGNFRPSVQIDTLEGRINDKDSLAGRHGSWILPYRLGVIGGLRKQADDSADLVRAAAITFPHGTGSPKIDGWTISSLGYGRLAPVNKQQPTDWPNFTVDDIMELWVNRPRG